MEILSTIRELISKGEAEQAIKMLDQVIEKNTSPRDEAYYLRGNAYRKMGNWQMALNNYHAAVELNPESPAKEAINMAMNILNFFNKDMFNH